MKKVNVLKEGEERKKIGITPQELLEYEKFDNYFLNMFL